MQLLDQDQAMTDEAVASGAVGDEFGPDEQDQAEKAKQQQEARKAALHAVVTRRRTEAVNARQASGIEQVWREDEDQYEGYDELNRPNRLVAISQTGQATASKKPGRSTVFLNITAPKTDSAEARLTEMLLPTDDKPWAFEPTPVPDLMKAIEGNDQTPVQLVGGGMTPAAEAAKAVMAKAQAACDEHEKWVEDHFIEGRVYTELRRVIRDAARAGTGIIKGPVPVSREDRRWQIQDGLAALSIAQRIAPTSKRVDYWDFFPDPACGEDIHAGSYCLERDYLTARKLRELAKDPTYDRAAVAMCLEEGPKKRARSDRSDDRDYPGQIQARDSDVFEVWYYYGDMPVEDLKALGLPELDEQLSGLDAQLTHVPAIATLVNDHIVKAVLNPLDTGDFPYDAFRWEVIGGQVWGRSVPRKMATAQRMLNAAARAMLENAGLSAGPQLILRKGMVEPADGKWEFTGRKLWFFTGDDTVKDVREVMQVLAVPSAQEELANIIQFALQMADETSSVPQLIQGEQNPGQPETLGGQTMRMNAANSGLRRRAKQFDDDLVIPHLGRWYDYGMQHGPESIKGDLQVKAKGSSTLFQRDQSNQFLMQSAPMLQNPAFKINPERWFAEVCKSNHYDPTAIQYTDEEWQKVQEQQAQQEPPKDPRVHAAELRVQATQMQTEARVAESQQRLQFEAQDREASRQHELLIASIEREIQVMEFAGRKEISLEQLRGMLTAKLADNQTKVELFNGEKALKLATGEGI
jgi:hypothetical protein